MEDVLYTVPELAKLLKTNVDYIHKLRKAGVLKFLKLGQWKCRKSTLLAFLEKYEGFDVTDPFNVKQINEGGVDDGDSSEQIPTTTRAVLNT